MPSQLLKNILKCWNVGHRATIQLQYRTTKKTRLKLFAPPFHSFIHSIHYLHFISKGVSLPFFSHLGKNAIIGHGTNIC